MGWCAVQVLFGGNWNNGANCGSRTANWNNGALNLDANIGSRSTSDTWGFEWANGGLNPNG